MYTNSKTVAVRKEWEYQYRDCDITYVWGFDVNEKRERIDYSNLCRNLNMSFL